MPVLNQTQIAERIALYQAYSNAVAQVADLAAQMPEVCPHDIRMDSPSEMRAGSEIERRVSFVIRRAWPALRKAVLADAEKELADAEAAVLAFERGDEVVAGASNASE